MPVDWKNIRESQFPALNNLTYLAAASSSPLLKSAYAKSMEYFNEMLNYGDLHHELFFLEIDQTRKQIAEYINAKPEEIAFLFNTSSGIHTIARLFKQEKGEILYPSVEFPASVHAFKRLGYPCRKVQQIENKYLVENFQNELKRNTKYIVHSHVQSFNGFRQNLEDLGKLCKDYNLKNIINSTQSFGAFRIDVKKYNIDIMVCCALKWIACGFGIGILYINEDIIKERTLPFTSWLSVENPFDMDSDNLNVIKNTRAIDSMGGCPNFASLYGLGGAFDLIKNKIGGGNIRTGIERIQERIISLTNEFLEYIQEFDFQYITPLEKEFRSGIITVEHNKAKKIHRRLSKNNIYVSLKKYPKSAKETLIRFGINYYNTSEDFERTVKFLREAFARL
ncbi:MAG: aminotransferase class V-fold PLP-dependent enzyme [Candidatus Lokiarchaeota archaeon]|nr:aminotransferase class V-fold PLP-dependent enzyme [Candidatus Lokiarchaeota archaeon]MBD3342776.1 aminotransferase class V-fold PLP-dependent enzyme [Candidatus Lokiarchaeota archaeon]